MKVLSGRSSVQSPVAVSPVPIALWQCPIAAAAAALSKRPDCITVQSCTPLMMMMAATMRRTNKAS